MEAVSNVVQKSNEEAMAVYDMAVRRLGGTAGQKKKI